MGSKLFVGGLPWAVDAAALQEAFSPFGTIEDAVVITDRDTGRSRGFGFVTFASEDDARKATEAMNESRLNGRTITVREARERAGGGGPRHPGGPRERMGDRPPRSGPPRDGGAFRSGGGFRDGPSGPPRGGFDRASRSGPSDRPPRPDRGDGGGFRDRRPRFDGGRGPQVEHRGPPPRRGGSGPSVERDEWGFVTTPSAPPPTPAPYDPAYEAEFGDPDAAGWAEDRQRRRDRNPRKKKKAYKRRDEFDDGGW